jgi:CMP-N,N'-diacetyllegionaminic acid synthase
MYRGKSIFGLIPARGGSKGLPQKNIRPLNGKPLIAWTIETALQFNGFDQVFVTTDDPEIATVSKQYGASVPFIRPAELATDEAKGIDVVIHALNWLAEHGHHYDLVFLLQPTSPLRQVDDIKECLDLFLQKQAGAIVSVCEAEHPPLWMNTLGPDLCMKDFLRKEIADENRQSLSKYYRINGALYLSDWDYLMKNQGFMGNETYAYIMPKERSVDIDTELDLKFAEFLLSETSYQAGT